jgi:hypothetical protein
MVRKLAVVMTSLAALLLSGCLITATANVPRVTVYTPPPEEHKTVVRVVEPPEVMVMEDPELVVIPGTYVYWLDGQDDVYFYSGGWWRSWNGYWYRADGYSGPWARIEMGRVPRPVTHLPGNWKQSHYDAPRVHWHETRNNWKGWENDRHWERQKWKKAPPPPDKKFPLKKK